MMIGQDEKMRQLNQLIEKFAPEPLPVLIQGETGTGKELVAKALHQQSGQKQGELVTVNCGALPPTLVESELFGHEKGSFSGAHQQAQGLIRQAHRGTLFLDEIGDLELQSQVKLLRFLEQGEVRPVGSSQCFYAQVRVVAATHQNLHQLVGEKRFRWDLFERLRVLELEVPPLRKRKEDIALFVNEFCLQKGVKQEAHILRLLENYPWPGNVRELIHLLERVSIVNSGTLSYAHIKHELALRSQAPLSQQGLWMQGSLEEIEKTAILARLERCQGNRKKTAEDLGIAKSTLHEKLRKWKEQGTLGMDPDLLADDHPLFAVGS